MPRTSASLVVTLLLQRLEARCSLLVGTTPPTGLTSRSAEGQIVADEHPLEALGRAAGGSCKALGPRPDRGTLRRHLSCPTSNCLHRYLCCQAFICTDCLIQEKDRGMAARLDAIRSSSSS